MSKYRIAFLVWWTALVLFITIFMYVNWDLMLADTYNSTFFVGWAVVIFAFTSWMPWSFRRRQSH